MFAASITASIDVGETNAPSKEAEDHGSPCLCWLQDTSGFEDRILLSPWFTMSAPVITWNR